MTIGIYAIINKVDGKCYVGKSVNIERRFSHHKMYLSRPSISPKQVNRHLFNAVKKYGLESFTFEILETFSEIDEQLIAERELFWMDYFVTTNRSDGYNLRRDSSTGMIVHEETRELLRVNRTGVNNPNYGKEWSDEKKIRMSELKSKQHAGGIYGDRWKSKISLKSKAFWNDHPDVKKQMAEKVKMKKQKFDFIQMDDDKNILKVWPSVESIIESNPSWKWQNIYSVCNGYKKRIYGYRWKKVLKNG